MSSNQWPRFVHQCVSHRIHGAKFQALAGVLQQDSPATGSQIVKAVLSSRQISCTPSDPLISRYIDALFAIGLVHVPDIISSLLQIWRTNAYKESSQDEGLSHARILDTIESDGRIVEEVLIAITTGKARLTAGEAAQSLSIVCDWLLIIVAWATSSAGTEEAHDTRPPVVAAFFENVGFLFATVVQQERGIAAITSLTSKGESWSRAALLSETDPGYKF